MDSAKLHAYLAAIDGQLEGDAVLVIYGSAAFVLMGQAERTTLDIDVAARYSTVDYPDLEQAAGKAGLAINPDETCRDDHIEWVPALRLCLPEPDDSTSVTLWQGRRLTVRTVPPAQLIASKLIRYDEIDAADVRFLCGQARVSFADVAKAVEELPPAFRDDPVVRDNLAALKTDMALWRTDR